MCASNVADACRRSLGVEYASASPEGSARVGVALHELRATQEVEQRIAGFGPQFVADQESGEMVSDRPGFQPSRQVLRAHAE